MLWIFFAFLAPFILMLTNVLDALLLRKVIGDARPGALLMTSAIGYLPTAVVAYYFAQTIAVSPLALALLLISGLCFFLYLPLYYYAITYHDGDIVIAFYSAIPVFLALYTHIFGIGIHAFCFVGMLLIVLGVFGAATPSWRHLGSLSKKLVVLSTLSSFIIAIGVITFQSAEATVGFWSALFWQAIGGFLGLGVLFFVSSYRTHMRDTFPVRTHLPFWSASLLNELIAQVGYAVLLLALTLGPTAYAQAINAGVQPLYMLAAWLLLARYRLISPDEASAHVSRRLLYHLLTGIGVALVIIYSGVNL